MVYNELETKLRECLQLAETELVKQPETNIPHFLESVVLDLRRILGTRASVVLKP